jgi:hypothetical protein
MSCVELTNYVTPETLALGTVFLPLPAFCLPGYPGSIVAGLYLEGKKAGLWHPRRTSAEHSIFSRHVLAGIGPALRQETLVLVIFSREICTAG